LVIYAGYGSSSTGVAVIYPIATVSSLHIPLAAVVGLLSVLE